MKAFVLHGINEIKWEEVPCPEPGRGEVLVKVKAAGICGSDIPRIYRTGAHRHPLIPGHEFSGTVVSAGAGVAQSWTGKRVGVFPLIPCRSCAPCRKGQYEMCQNYGYLGSRQDGAFAEYAAVPADNLIELPESVPFEAAAMLEPMAVAVHAMRRILPELSVGGAVSPKGGRGGDAASDIRIKASAAGPYGQPAKGACGTVAVCGLGTIGMLLSLFLREAGVSDVLLIGNKDFQRETALKLGFSADVWCDTRKQDVCRWLTERTAGEGADVFFECVGKNETLVQAVRSAAPGGRIMLVGNPFSDMSLEKETYWKILRSQLTVMGTWNSSFSHEGTDDWHYVLERLSAKRIAPEMLISHRLGLEDLEQGLHIMRDKTEDYGKIMVIS